MTGSLGGTGRIVGYGDIGKVIEQRIAAFKADVVRVARRARPEDHVHGADDLDDLLPDLDAVILIVPLPEETGGLVDGEFLARLRG